MGEVIDFSKNKESEVECVELYCPYCSGFAWSALVIEGIVVLECQTEDCDSYMVPYDDSEDI